MKLMGITLTTDLKFKTDTDEPTKKQFSNLQMVKRLATKGEGLEDLKTISECSGVWNCSITQEAYHIKAIQKLCLHCLLKLIL